MAKGDASFFFVLYRIGKLWSHFWKNRLESQNNDCTRGIKVYGISVLCRLEYRLNNRYFKHSALRREKKSRPYQYGL